MKMVIALITQPMSYSRKYFRMYELLHTI